ncbi:MAG: VWA domain-containing protein [Clostridiales bacterium]|nr:VWA domain-containing protein [Clostridiales bacterium]
MLGLLGRIMLNPIIPVPTMAVICVVLIIFKRRGVIPYIRQILAVLLLFLINLRPMYPSENVKVQRQKMDLNVVFVVDDTISMLADDQPDYENRLERVKSDMNYIIDNLPGAKFSIVCFNNYTHVLTPYTDSLDYVRNAIDSIYPLSPYYATGTNINICLDTLTTVLTTGRESSGTVNTVMFVMSDGENTNDRVMESFSKLEHSLSGGAVLGYGTERGGHMYYYNSIQDRIEIVMNRNTNPPSEGISKLNEENLQSIATDLDLPYMNMANDGNLDPILQNMMENYLTEPEEVTRRGYTDIYYILVIPLVALTAYEFISLKRRG